MESKSQGRGILICVVPLVILAMMARVGIAYISWGSQDATQFQEFGKKVAQHGIMHLYRVDVMYNHPPALGYFCAFVYRLTHGRLDQPDIKSARHLGLTFPFVFKGINLLADIIVCWLLWKIARPQFGQFVAAATVVLFAWSPDSLLMTGFHGNDDPVYAMLCLLAIYLIEDRGRDFWGGVALAAAINVKLIPVLLVPPLLMSYRDWRRTQRFIVGLSLGIIPFIPVVLLDGPAFYRDVLTYGSAITNWGINQFLKEAAREPRFSAIAGILIERYYTTGRLIIIAAVILLSLRARRDPRLNRYTLAACTLCLFMILTPGFGLQYTIIPLPLLYATGRRLAATLYGILSGILLFFTYWQLWFGSWPIDADSDIGPVAPGPLFALLAWATLVVFVFTELRAGKHEPVKLASSPLAV